MLPPPPPPSAIKAGVGRSGLQLQAQTLPRPPQQFSDSPQEFPLTRSVSTTTEIYAAQNLSISGGATKTDYSNNRRRNVATNTRYNTDTHTQTNGGSGNNNSQQRNNLNIHSKKTIHQQQQHDNIYNKNYATTCANTINGNVIGNNNHENVVDDGVDDNDDVDDDDEDEPTQKLCGLKRSIRKTKDELFEEFCKRAGVRPKPKNIYYIPNDDDDDDDDHHQPVPHNDDNKTLTAAQQQSLDIDDEEVMLHKPLRLNNIRTGGGNMQQQQQQRHSTTPGNHHQLQQHHGNMGDYGATSNAMENNRIFGETMDVVDIDEDVDENGFKKITENEDHLYVIDGKWLYIVQHI